jgi:hypothetical protein
VSRAFHWGHGLALVALAGLVLPAVFARAQDQATKLPPAKEILAKHLKAIGGKDAILKHKSSHSKGKYEVPAQGITGELEILMAAPNKMLVKVNIPGIGEILQGFDGKVGWSLNPATGPALIEGKPLDDLRDSAAFHGAADEEKNYKSMETLERTKFDDKECYKVKLVRKSGKEVVQFFDAKTGLLAGSQSKQETPQGAFDVTTTLSDYKEFGGIKTATKTTQDLGIIKQVLTLESVEYDKVDDKVFALPPQIKGLLSK